ncbi:uncharacterized protein LOC132724594 [Ruditapes philippinarum]|uniref:uncharacterized protein LOC132724594 n=1 Tax=Ruditapes philippinarum TaxID=129788 RepID=UPI00295A94A5|nr:uncharacterized protein LOC132724594 [Ruditapes philippinarum]
MESLQRLRVVVNNPNKSFIIGGAMLLIQGALSIAFSRLETSGVDMIELVNQGKLMCCLAVLQLIIGSICLYITIDFRSYIPHLAYCLWNAFVIKVVLQHSNEIFEYVEEWMTKTLYVAQLLLNITGVMVLQLYHQYVAFYTGSR